MCLVDDDVRYRQVAVNDRRVARVQKVHAGYDISAQTQFQFQRRLSSKMHRKNEITLTL